MLQTGDRMRKAFILIVALQLLSSCASINAVASPPEASAPSPSYVFSLIGTDLETRKPVAIVGLVQTDLNDRITGKATLNDGGHICTARISGMVKRSPDGSQNAFLTLSSDSGDCPSPLEFTGVLSSSGKLFAAIEVDSKLVTAGAAWMQ